MKLLVAALLGFASLALVGCDEEALPGHSKQRTVVPVANVLGRWEMDSDGFVQENWKLLSDGPRKVAETHRLERARMATMEPADRATAEQKLEDRMNKLSAEQRELIEAALGTQEQLKALMRKLVGQRMVPSCVTLDFQAGGSCKFLLAIPGQERQDADGTWSQQGDRVTVRLTTANGKPAKGKDLQASTMTIRSDRLLFVPKPGGPTIVARRSA